MIFEKICGSPCEEIESLEGEFWVDVKGFEGFYKVSNLGRVCSLPRVVSNGKTVDGTFTKKPKINKNEIMRLGYERVTLSKDGKTKRFQLHRLVLSSFTGILPKDLHCCHNDGDPTNNNLNNLRWDTPSNNNKDKEKHGTWQAGVKNGNSFIDEETVIFIRESKLTHREMSRLIGLDDSGVSKIRRGLSYKNCGGPIWST